MSDNYQTSIPESAEERITETYPDGQKKRAEYLLDGAVIGYRFFDEHGVLGSETPLKSGVIHGTQYWWWDNGKLDSALPYVDGLEHGVARQWSRDGGLVGT